MQQDLQEVLRKLVETSQRLEELKENTLNFVNYMNEIRRCHWEYVTRWQAAEYLNVTEQCIDKWTKPGGRLRKDSRGRILWEDVVRQRLSKRK